MFTRSIVYRTYFLIFLDYKDKTKLKVINFSSLKDFKPVNQICAPTPHLSTFHSSTFVLVIISRNLSICSYVALYMGHTSNYVHMIMIK
jgi:hypothetical protein